MTQFNYEAIDKRSGEVIRPKGLEAVILCNIIRAILSEHKKACEANAKGLDDLRFDYFKEAKLGANTIEYSIKNKAAEGDMRTAIEKVGTAMDMAKASVDELGARLVVMSDFDEMSYFFKETAMHSIDSLKLLKNKHESKVGGGWGSHYVKVEMNHDGNEWLIELTTQDGADTKKDISVNGVPSPKMGSDAAMVNMILSMVGLIIQKDLMDEHIIKQYEANVEFTKKAKAMASILGGDYKGYLIFVAGLYEHMPYLGRKSTDKDNSIELIIKSQLRADEQQLSEVAKIFADKPRYH